jgi:hypothetical protein
MILTLGFALATLATTAFALPAKVGQWQKKVLTRPTNHTTVGPYRTSPMINVTAPASPNRTHGTAAAQASTWYSGNWAGAVFEQSSVSPLRRIFSRDASDAIFA